jgi:hypothetical protein
MLTGGKEKLKSQNKNGLKARKGKDGTLGLLMGRHTPCMLLMGRHTPVCLKFHKEPYS